jgi:enoyl-CoA hydratase
MIEVFEISNPAKRNALDGAMCARIAEWVGGLAGRGVRAGVLVGDPAGRAFSAGFDLDALGDLAAAAAAFDALVRAVAESAVPLVAALNGPAIGGGCELAATCDLRVAHAGVKLGMPPARLGIVYPTRGLARFAALCGESRARQLFLLARTVDAAEAHRWGLVDFLVDEADVRPRAEALATEIAALAPHAVQGMRRLFEARFSPGGTRGP